MDPQADSDEEFVVLSTSDCTESTSYPGSVFPQAGGLKSNAKLFVKSMGFLPSMLGARATEIQASGTARTDTRKYSETRPGRDTVEQLVNNYYNYYITGGFGGSGGEGGDQGGDGGTGQGPTVYFGQPQTQEQSDFRTISRGDLKLVKKVRLSPQSSVVGRQSRGVGVRRTVYHAEIRGEPGTMTVAVYQGDSAEELVLTRSIIKSPQFWRATDYIDDVTGSSMYNDNPSIWIRSATGELCLDLAQRGPSMRSQFDYYHPVRLEKVSWDAPDLEDMIISSLSEGQYHELCYNYSTFQSQRFLVSTQHPVGPGIFRLDSQYRITVPLQTLPESELHWNDYGNGNAPGELLPNSWIRYDFPRMFALELGLNLWFPLYEIRKAWMAQANHIFAKLQEREQVEDYVCIDDLQFHLRITDERDIPEGYLFVCPPQDFRTGIEPHAHLYQWPTCPAYWSLHPSGADRLRTEDAKNLGFPAIHIETSVQGWSWDRSVYQGLRRFHEGKGFDPDSGEVARRLEYPPFEVLSDPVLLLARKGELQLNDLFYAIFLLAYLDS
ncbi:hypothetical protein MSAN_01514700 [Mycena sanguinolenta]|uniref:Uncharacterized protein n=1 Tax=Mycena sanguinolenta TaxID=230812 RepID=A0A8H6Y361_9AGAR|nr:hypothetical protein MSAN_01514700 [Mycena sanguinolenta]